MGSAAVDAVKAAAVGFVGASHTLFVSKEHRLAPEWHRMPPAARAAALSNEQLAALVVALASLLVLVAFSGFAFIQSQAAGAAEPEDELKMEKRLGKGPSGPIKAFSVATSAATVAFALHQGVTRYRAQADLEQWPEHFGLLCGLGSVAVAQVALIAYQFARRKELFGSEAQSTIQVRPAPYERSFVGDVVHHLSNPGAFILMLPYLCLTWMFRLMPESYYEYEAPVNWWHVLAQLVVVDFFTFVFHVTEHSLPEFYKVSHKPHHRFVSPQFFNAFDGSLADTVALILFPLFATAQLLHVSNWDYIAFGTVYSTHFMLIHSEFVHALDPALEFFFVNVAEDHHVHHATFNSNFSHFFTIYDKLAGTYRSGSTCRGFRSSPAEAGRVKTL